MEGQLEFRTERLSEGESELLFIHGYGGNMEQPGVRWMMNRFIEAGFGVTYIQLPTRFASFDEEVLAPVMRIQKGLDDHVIAAFSLGGLAAVFLEGARRRVFLSPFWGINDRWTFKGLGTVLNLLASINIPHLKRHFEKEDAGPLAEDDDLKGVPDFVDPKTIHEMHQAQRNIPPPMENDIAYYCPEDKVISISAVEARGIYTRQFSGGHMFYLSRDRVSIMEDIISDLRSI